jgi:hypothetical protein
MRSWDLLTLNHQNKLVCKDGLRHSSFCFVFSEEELFSTKIYFSCVVWFILLFSVKMDRENSFTLYSAAKEN